MSSPSRRLTVGRAVFRRWGDLLLYGLIGAALWALLGGIVLRLARPLIAQLAALGADGLTLALIGLAAGFILARRWPRWRVCCGSKRPLRYPPLRVGVLLGLGMLTIGALLTGNSDAVAQAQAAIGSWASTTGPWLFVGVLVALAIDHSIWFAGHVPATVEQQAPGGPAPTLAQMAGDYDAIVEWIEDDREITHPSQDRFGHAAIAKRIARRLTESLNPDDATSNTPPPPPSIAIVGEKGSGKSTVVQLVKHELKSEPNIIFETISLWPYDTTQAAMKGVLDTIIEMIGTHAGTTALTTLSSTYIGAIESVAGRWGGLARLLEGDKSPEKILGQIDTIATALGISLVICIEDIERFTGTDQWTDPSQDTGGKSRYLTDKERAAPIMSMLHLLDRCERVSAIICDASLRSRIDVTKIVRYVERPPKIEPVDIWKILTVVRNRHLQDYAFDPCEPKRRSMLTMPKDEDSRIWWFFAIEHSRPYIQQSIALNINTPRTLKNIMLQTYEAWTYLKGEIDYDSMLVFNVLRETHPTVYSTIISHKNTIQEEMKAPTQGNPSTPHEWHPAILELDAYIKSVSEETLKNSVVMMLSYCFPNMSSALNFLLHKNTCSVDQSDCPQGLFNSSRSDYLSRLLKMDPISDKESDQKALIMIHAWIQGEDKDLIERITGTNRMHQIEMFSRQFSPRDMLRLLKEVVKADSQHSSRNTWKQRHTYGFYTVWRMLFVVQIPRHILHNRLERIIKVILPSNLPCAIDLCYCFAQPDRPEHLLLDPLRGVELFSTLIETFKMTYVPDKAEQMLEAVQDAPYYTIASMFNFCKPQRSIPMDKGKFSDWDDIANLLLHAAEHDPSFGVAILMPFMTKVSDSKYSLHFDDDGNQHRTTTYDVTFNETQARDLFDYDRLMKILLKASVPEEAEEELTRQFQVAIEAARKWEREQAHAPDSPDSSTPSDTP